MSNIESYEKIKEYVAAHPLATVSTVDTKGNPHGAVVYTCHDERESIVYFLTKDETQKYRNLTGHDTVSITIVSPADNSTLQATGKAFTVHDAHALDLITRRMVTANPGASDWLPPVSKLDAGHYVVVGIKLRHARLAEFQGTTLIQEHIFTTA